MAAAAPAFTCHSRKQKEGRDEEGIWKTKDGRKFLDNCPTEKWGFCPLPLNELLCPLQSGSNHVVPVSKPMSEETWQLTQSLGIFSVEEWALGWWNWPSCVPYWRGPVWGSGERSLWILAIPPSPPPCQLCGPCRPARSPAACYQLTQWRKKQVVNPQNCEKQ